MSNFTPTKVQKSKRGTLIEKFYFFSLNSLFPRDTRVNFGGEPLAHLPILFAINHAPISFEINSRQRGLQKDGLPVFTKIVPDFPDRCRTTDFADFLK